MRFLFALAALALAGCASDAAIVMPAPMRALEQGWSELQLDVTPARISENAGIGARYGRLIFRGGVELKSTNPLFGGWSGIDADASGRFVAVSDKGSFMAGALVLDSAGDLVGVTDAKIGLIRTKTGEPAQQVKEYDAEDIARLPDGRYAVSFEQAHRVDIYDLDGQGPIAPAQAGPPTPQDMVANEGMEALAFVGGELIAGRELAADYGATTQIFKLTLDGRAPVVGTAVVDKGFGLVSMRRLPDGDLLAMERFFLPIIGVKIVFRIFPAAGLKSDPPRLTGPEIARLEKPLTLDNFEGLTVTRRGSVTRLYIITDNNFSATNKTLIYAFDLAG